ncbi:integrase [Sphingobium sp. 22B]|uniref:tyrosine-type recombinase/integrase n=1 Tax=unclassified Sphingobium TaxID=2611147 RepID=UPI0007867BFD|nr:MULTISPECIES: tyrosine-type recombinase/integrase [unclassified Sphingobium]KXU29841.1 integrase [Sphingobium sp. AM]KYC30389.1 integrase [Sphingobium sp. 22B]MEC6701175.1 tyrosine-type recombinase/integrase [Sphingobium sp. SJ10-10]OAP29981.1 integrase [Sphingobium sp. 20006FA]
MLSVDLARYVALHEALGFRFRTQRSLLRMFVAYAERHGDALIKSDRAIAWAVEAPSPEQRRNRLLTVRRFAIAMHAEDPDHEVPAADALGRGLFRRTQPYIYSAGEIERLMAAAASLGPSGTLRPLTYFTLFGLLAATGMRISEALALRLGDVTEDGLIVANTKFKKSRLIPIHSTTRAAIDRYLSVRLTIAGGTPALFVSNTGTPPRYDTVSALFRQLSRNIGLRGAPGQPGPRIHDLRHSFAVRSLEQCPCNGDAVSHHVLALSTYLGHAHVSDTYWYLQATPGLMAQIADVGETFGRTGAA